MSDYEMYLLISGADKTADALGLSVSWDSSGWAVYGYTTEEEVLRKILMVRGETAKELIHYLNGFSDGQRIKED